MQERKPMARTPALGLMCAACMALLLTPVRGRADVLYTADGSKLVGTIEQWTNGKVTIVTDFAGKLELDAGKVIAFTSDKTLIIAFTSGDRLVGRVSADADLSACTVQTTLDAVPIELAKIKALWPEGTDSPEVVALRRAADKLKEAMRPKWTAQLEAGGTATDGNTHTLNARGRFDVTRKTVSNLLHFFVAADYSEQDDTRSKNEYRGGIDYEAHVSARRYWYARTELEQDEFENLDLRATATAGVGYYWLKREDHEFKTRVGAGFRHESFDDEQTRDDPVLDLGFDYRLDIAPTVQLTHSTTYSPDFEDFDSYRLDVDTALAFPLKKDAWKLKVGMRNEYNSRPVLGLERLDNTYYANIVLELTD